MFKLNLGDKVKVEVGTGEVVARKDTLTNKFYKVKTAQNSEWYPEEYFEPKKGEVVDKEAEKPEKKEAEEEKDQEETEKKEELDPLSSKDAPFYGKS